MNYFDKLPTISYNGHVVKNILARPRLSDETRSNAQLYYPYTMKEHDRIDNLSQAYYDNPGYTWLIWLTNNIIDPYYGTPMTEEQLQSFIKTKYGSIDVAARSTKCYRNNWYRFTEDRITSGEFDLLPASYKKYYDPVLNSSMQVSSYRRRADDTILNTNALARIDTAATFKPGEIISSGSKYATVVDSDGESTLVQHLHGSFAAGDQIVGRQSSVIGTVEAFATMSTSFAFDEPTYWDEVTVLDFEQEVNNAKKEIYLMDNRYKSQADSELKRLMNE